MARLGGYFLALFWTALLGSFLNSFLWFILYQIDPPQGFQLDMGFYVLTFFLGAFLCFFTAIPGFLLAYLWEIKIRRFSFFPHLIIYLIYLAIGVYYLGWGQWDAIIGFHTYIFSGIFCSYMFIWRHELKKEEDLLDI